jgi:hypothetical protein
MTLLDAIVATGLTNTEIAGIVSATLMGLTALGGVVVKLVVARRPIDLAAAKREQKRDADESLRFRTQHAFAERIIEGAEEHLEAEKAAHERTREKHEASVQENGRLQEENGQLRFWNIALTDRVEALEKSDHEKTEQINALKDEVIECHEGRAADMRNTVSWIMENFVPRNDRVTTPPRPRSITPRDMPAVSANVDNKSK